MYILIPLYFVLQFWEFLNWNLFYHGVTMCYPNIVKVILDVKLEF